MKTILVPLGGSTFAEQVLLYVSLHGGGADSHTAFIHVCDRAYR
jgi:hypothetical protein